MNSCLELRKQALRIVHFLLTCCKSAGTRLLCVVVIEVKYSWISSRPTPRLFGALGEIDTVVPEISLRPGRIDLAGVGKRCGAHQTGGRRCWSIVAWTRGSGRWARIVVQPLNAKQ